MLKNKNYHQALILVGCGLIVVAIVASLLLWSRQPDDSDCQSNPETACADKAPSSYQNGQKITLTATSTCLPKSNTEGLSTMECAGGLQTADGNIYAFETNDNRELTIELFQSGQLLVSGTYRADYPKSYKSSGTIVVDSVRTLE